MTAAERREQPWRDAGLDIQRWVGFATAVAAVLIAVINTIGAPPEYRADALRLLSVPQVWLVGLTGVVAFLTAVIRPLRWLQVVLIMATGVVSARMVTSLDLAPFVWLLAGLILGWEYGYFITRGALKAGVVAGGFFLIWGERMLVEARFPFATVGAYIVVAALLGTFAWLLIVYKHRQFERRQVELEEAVEARTSELSDALGEQKLLLAELHHRTKNNLQLVGSMLWFEADSLDATASAQKIESVQRRIHSLGRVHDLLYATSGTGDVNISAFIADYLDEAVLVVDTRSVVITRTLEANVRLRTDLAIRLGLILNEIVINTLEHAVDQAAPGDSGHRAIDIALRVEDSDLVLVAADDGPGITIGPSERIGTGIQLIESMATRLGGSAVLEAENGTRWTIRLPLNRRESRWD